MARFAQKDINGLTAANIEVMQALGQYRYLTPSQIVELGIISHRDVFYQLMKRFNAFPSPIVGQAAFSEVHSNGKQGRKKLESVHYLTRRGAELLSLLDHDNDREAILSVARQPLTQKDYWHRRETIDLQILVNQFAFKHGCTIEAFDLYFNHEGANHSKSGHGRRKANTTITYELTDHDDQPLGIPQTIMPDAILKLTDPTGHTHLFAIEIQRGMDTKRLHHKLRDQYIPALGEGAINGAYGVKPAPLILTICENPGLMEQTLKRLRDDPYFVGFGDHFAFHTSETLLPPPPTQPKDKRFKITRDTRRDLSEVLEDWQGILTNDHPPTKQPLRWAQGWQFIEGERGIFAT